MNSEIIQAAGCLIIILAPLVWGAFICAAKAETLKAITQNPFSPTTAPSAGGSSKPELVCYQLKLKGAAAPSDRPRPSSFHAVRFQLKQSTWLRA